MDPVLSHQAEERALLRVKYDKAVSDMLNALNTAPKAAFPEDQLRKLGVELASFEPEDPGFLESKACLFKLLPSEELEEWSLDESDLGGALHYYFAFDELYDRPTHLKHSPESSVIHKRAEKIFYHLNILYKHLERKNGRDIEFFKEIYGWDHIRDGNSFQDGLMGLFYGLRRGVPEWNTKAVCEWQDDCDDPETISPHIMLVICTGAEAKDGELIFGELAPIAQAIQNRLDQKEFVKTSLFPVFAVSLFGPRHGRLIQARFTKSGVLKVRASRIYSFVRKAEAPFTLFLRFYVCGPTDGLEYEFYSDTEEVTRAEAHKYVAPSPAFGKENMPPKPDDHVLSFEVP